MKKKPTILVRHVAFELLKRNPFTNEETYTFFVNPGIQAWL